MMSDLNDYVKEEGSKFVTLLLRINIRLFLIIMKNVLQMNLKRNIHFKLVLVV